VASLNDVPPHDAGTWIEAAREGVVPRDCALVSYPVRIEDGTIWVAVPDRGDHSRAGVDSAASGRATSAPVR
jgi:hypothetical protein